jgi:hypothetical protein
MGDTQLYLGNTTYNYIYMYIYIHIKHQLLPACAKLSAAAFGPHSEILDASKTLKFNRKQAQKNHHLRAELF